MRILQYRHWRADIHRYFPDWAQLPIQDGTPLEADRNSYSAAGYAEEFGYCSQQGLPLPAPELDGDPESSGQWRYQIRALHPGYPECAAPVNRDQSSGASFDLRSAADADAHDEGRLPFAPRKFTVIRVSRAHRDTAGVSLLLPERLGELWRALRFRSSRSRD